MARLRFEFLATLAWFFALYNIERIHQPLDIASFLYAYTAFLTVLILVIPRVSTLSLSWLLVIPPMPFLLLKLYFGYDLFGSNLPITVTETCAIELTAIFARNVATSLDSLQHAATNAILNHLNNLSRPFDVGQGDLYRELRRARMYNRPLALMAITASHESTRQARDRFAEELQREAIDRYVMARIAELLSEEMRDCDIIAERNDHFVAVLPETDQAQACEISKAIEAVAREKLGLELRVGLCTFPDQEVTLEKLLERAETAMADTVGLKISTGELVTR